MSEPFDDIAVLGAANWPALLVDAAASIRQANPAAVEFFGSKVEGGAAPLATLWTNENGGEPAAILEKVKAARAVTAPLKLRGKGMAITPFNASICLLQRNGSPLFL